MNEEQLTFKSQILGNERTVWIQQTEAHLSPTKLLIILDGELYRERVEAPKIIQELYQEQRIEPTTVVYVSYFTEKARWIECPCHSPFAQFIIRELYPWILSRLSEPTKIKESVIAGLSYTGLAASFVALESEGLFKKVISQSGSYWSNDCWLSSKVEKIEESLDISFYLDVGDQETQTNVTHKADVIQRLSQISGVETFRDALTAKGIQIKYKVFEGGHSFDAWAKTLPEALQWALGPTSRLTSTDLAALNL